MSERAKLSVVLCVGPGADINGEKVTRLRHRMVELEYLSRSKQRKDGRSWKYWGSGTGTRTLHPFDTERFVVGILKCTNYGQVGYVSAKHS